MINLLTPLSLCRLEQYTQLIVGFSGGLDSTVLLHLLASSSSLHHRLVAVHVNHGISPNALSWQEHAARFCLGMGVPFSAHSVRIHQRANLEEEARKARYGVFSSLTASDACVILGHHLDDQAETLLLNLFRGAGVDGLAAMPQWGHCGAGDLFRPLLSCSRKQLEDYARAYQLSWIEDESNQDLHYSRNLLRHQIIPLLEKKWPGVAKNIARTALHCQQARANLEALAQVDCEALLTEDKALRLAPLKEWTEERRANAVRFWLKEQGLPLPGTRTFLRLINEVLLARDDAMPLVSWGGIEVRRYRGCFYLDKKKKRPNPLWLNGHIFLRRSY